MEQVKAGGGGIEASAQVESKMTGGKKEPRKVESLGWITESSVMPKKQRAIQGVGASSIVELRAELYRTQEDVKKAKEGGGGDLDTQRPRKKLGAPDIFSKKNSGVEERAGRDKLHLKEENDGSASYAALEKKAELYDKIVRGEVSDGEDEEKYNVLFVKKGTLEAEFQDMEKARRGEISYNDTDRSKTSAFDHSRDQDGNLLASEKLAGWNTRVGLSQEHKAIVRDVNLETIQARESVSRIKQLREASAAKKREQLRKAYIKKQIEKMKAASRNAGQVQPSLGDTIAPAPEKSCNVESNEEK